MLLWIVFLVVYFIGAIGYRQFSKELNPIFFEPVKYQKIRVFVFYPFHIILGLLKSFFDDQKHDGFAVIFIIVEILFSIVLFLCILIRSFSSGLLYLVLFAKYFITDNREKFHDLKERMKFS